MIINDTLRRWKTAKQGRQQSRCETDETRPLRGGGGHSKKKKKKLFNGANQQSNYHTRPTVAHRHNNKKKKHLIGGRGELLLPWGAAYGGHHD